MYSRTLNRPWEERLAVSGLVQCKPSLWYKDNHKNIDPLSSGVKNKNVWKKWFLKLPLLFRFRREKEAYNQMLRHEADHMRARGAHARVGTLHGYTLINHYTLNMYELLNKRAVEMAGYWSSLFFMYIYFCVVNRDVKERKHTEINDRTNLVNNYKVIFHDIFKGLGHAIWAFQHWSNGHRINWNNKVTAQDYKRTQAKHRKARKGQGRTKLGRIEVDCIRVNLKNVGPPFLSVYIKMSFKPLENHSQLLCVGDLANERLLLCQFNV